jgi:arsenite methyltransferase
MLRRRSCPMPIAKQPRWPTRWLRAGLAPARRYLSRQAQRPHGPGGRLMGRIWIRETAAANDTAIELLTPRPGERILELGFGPGRTIARLATLAAHVTGVDPSTVMVAAATRRNAGPIAAGRVHVHQGDGNALPDPDQSIDAALSVHTIYFWSDPTRTVTELARVLRPGGRLVLAFRPGEHPLPARLDPDIYHVPTTSQAIQWLQTAGFTDVQARTRPDTDPALVWLVATRDRS